VYIPTSAVSTIAKRRLIDNCRRKYALRCYTLPHPFLTLEWQDWMFSKSWVCPVVGADLQVIWATELIVYTGDACAI